MADLLALKDKAIDRLSEFLDVRDHTAMEVAAARIACGTLNAWAKVQQTAGAREALLFTMARELATDKEQLERYVQVAMPKSPFTKALTGK